MSETAISPKTQKLPQAFLLRRLHSLTGVWLTLYLFQHLLVNSQAALFFENRGAGFISMVNKIHNLPYLPVIEIVFLGLPFLIHGWWGIIYLRSAKQNSLPSDGSKPSLPMYKENRAYTWQRITAILLVIGIIAHVIHMRFVDAPNQIYQNNKRVYLNWMKEDTGLEKASLKVGAKLFTAQMLSSKKEQLQTLEAQSEKEPENLVLKNLIEEKRAWLDAAFKKSLMAGDVVVESPNAGTAFILVLRESFKSPLMVGLYSLFVLVAAYHGFNGLWTFMITWGVTLTRYSQKIMRRIAGALMLLVSFLGLMAAIGTYLSLKF